LVEGETEESPEVYLGRTQGQAPDVDGAVYVKGASEQDIGRFVEVKILRADNYDLVGEVAR
jgi:ribosomal protein S12 methylthiotransferase